MAKHSWFVKMRVYENTPATDGGVNSILHNTIYFNDNGRYRVSDGEKYKYFTDYSKAQDYAIRSSLPLFPSGHSTMEAIELA